MEEMQEIELQTEEAIAVESIDADEDDEETPIFVKKSAHKIDTENAAVNERFQKISEEALVFASQASAKAVDHHDGTQQNDSVIG